MYILFWGWFCKGNTKKQKSTKKVDFCLQIVVAAGVPAYFFVPSGLPPLSDSRIWVSAWMFWNL